jgi:hypothetical protein
MADKKILGVDFVPTMALAKVLLCDYHDTSNFIRALLNPTSIEFSINVGIGKPQPVGWTGPIKQYSHTGEVVTGIELVINEFALARAKGYKAFRYYAKNAIVTILDYVNWISSFCYAKEAGSVPHPMIIHWPSVTTMAVVLESFKVKFTRFNRNLTPVEGVITLGISEQRFSFQDSDSQGLSGFLSRGSYSISGGTSNGGRGGSGSPLNPGSGV